MALAFIVCFADGYFYRHRPSSLLFLAIISGVCLLRLVHLPAFRWMQARFEVLNNVLFMVFALTNALAWGFMFAHLMQQPGEHESKLLMVITSAGLASGGVVAYIPYFRLSLLFNAFMFLPAVILMWVNGTYPTISILMLLYSLYMVFMARRGNAEYWNALKNEFLLEQKTKILEHHSRVDGLTGLFNRRHFDAVLQYEWKRAQRSQAAVTLLIGDIDHFKAVNDRFGHPAGDAYLKLTADILSRVFQRETDIVARYGGEEFVVLMPGGDLQTAGLLAEKVRRRLAAAILDFEGQTIQTTLSIGLASRIPKPEEDFAIMLAAADKALYQAKQSGRDRVMVADKATHNT